MYIYMAQKHPFSHPAIQPAATLLSSTYLLNMKNSTRISMVRTPRTTHEQSLWGKPSDLHSLMRVYKLSKNPTATRTL